MAANRVGEPLHVRATQCKDCLFTKNRLVSAKRAGAIIKECLETEKHFACHEYDDPDDPAHHHANVCCHAFYKQYPDVSAYSQISTRLGLVQWIDAEGRVVKVGGNPPDQEDCNHDAESGE